MPGQNINVKIIHYKAETSVSFAVFVESNDSLKTSHRTNPSKRKKVIVYDEQKAVAWLDAHKFYECYRDKKPRIVKPAVRRLLEEGIEIPGLRLE